jgi:threonine/homoserine/homoserine lactone efflux protein
MYVHQFFQIIRALLFGYLIGLVISVLLGPSRIESVKKTISRGIKNGFTVSLGAISADLSYLFLINYGLSSLLSRNRQTEALFWIISGTILSLIGYVSIRNIKKQNFKLRLISENFNLLSMPFLAGYLITFFNPTTPSLWLTLSGTVIRAWYYVSQVCYYTFLISIIAGMLTWFFLLNHFTLKSMNFLSHAASIKAHSLFVYTTFIIGILFILFGILKLFNLI